MFKFLDETSKLKVKCPNSLQEKVCIPKNSRHQYFFTFGRLGKPLWTKTLESLKIPDFLFFDPDNHDIPISYNSLFDPHLGNYFKHKRVLNHLRKNHLITNRNEVVCSAKEFNDNRKLLNRLKTEASCFTHANNVVVVDNIKKIQKAPPKLIFHKQHLNKRNEMQEIKKGKFLDKIKLYENHLKRIEIIRKLRENEIKERGLYRNLELIKKQAYVLEKRKAYREKLKKRIFDKTQAHMSNDEDKETINYIIRCPLNV